MSNVRKEMIRIKVTHDKSDSGVIFISGAFPDVCAMLGEDVDMIEVTSVMFGGLTEAAMKAFSFAIMNPGKWCSQYGVSNENTITEFMSKDGDVSQRDVTQEFEDFEE